MVWKIDNPQGNESAKIKWEIVPYTRGKVLDLGCGPFKTFPHFTGVDNGHHDQAFGWNNRADVIVDSCVDLGIFNTNGFDAVFSSHLLEHIEDYKAALSEWWRVVKPGGYLILYLPHKKFYPNVGQEGANPDHKHDFYPEDIQKAMFEIGKENNGWDVIRNEDRNEGIEYSFFQVYKKLDKKGQFKFSFQTKKPKKTCAVVRYGAFGDLIMASSVFPGLKEQGYHVTLYTVPSAYEVVRNDPHIDRVILQDKDQIPNDQLHDFWASIEKKYDKFVNLCEVVEGTLLTTPNRINNSWPESLRHEMLNKNYLEWHHKVADVPLPIRQEFYPTDSELEWAEKERRAMGADSKVVLWSLAGSSVHKAWPHLDAVIARAMVADKNLKFVLVGDDMCRILEGGWEEEPRVYLRSGEWSIRQSMAFCMYADMVVGPETGVLNAAAMMDTPKAIFLSHSSIENLTKHWKNTISLEPKTSCYPCHRMHYNFDQCKEEPETRTSQCMFDIGADEVYEAIQKGLTKIWQVQAA